MSLYRDTHDLYSGGVTERLRFLSHTTRIFELVALGKPLRQPPAKCLNFHDRFISFDATEPLNMI